MSPFRSTKGFYPIMTIFYQESTKTENFWINKTLGREGKRITMVKENLIQKIGQKTRNPVVLKTNMMKMKQIMNALMMILKMKMKMRSTSPLLKLVLKKSSNILKST